MHSLIQAFLLEMIIKDIAYVGFKNGLSAVKGAS